MYRYENVKAFTTVEVSNVILYAGSSYFWLFGTENIDNIFNANFGNISTGVKKNQREGSRNMWNWQKRRKSCKCLYFVCEFLTQTHW